jgi:PhnB protein
MRAIPYLYFLGDCEAALEFYAACGLGRITELRRYAGSPMAEREGGAWRDKVIHARFEGEGLTFYAADTPNAEPMRGVALLIEVEAARAAKLFRDLSDGGRVTMPFKTQFWGDAYGNFTDRHGVQWAVMSPADTTQKG